MNKQFLSTNVIVDGVFREETLDGVNHLVFPVVALVEGVLKKILYPGDEIKKNAKAWSGVPVTVRHPKVNGQFISANSPKIQDSQNIGVFYNTTYDEQGKRLKGEAWINEQKASRLGFDDLLTRLKEGEIMELSTGLWLDADDSQKGVFNGKAYEGLARNMVPDHLALLPDEKGACSVEDGCGVRANCEGGTCQCGGKCKRQSLWDKARAFFGLTRQVENADSFRRIKESVRVALKGKVQSEFGPYIVEAFDDFVVYEDDQSKLFKQKYNFDSETSKATLIGEAEQVKIKTEYVGLSDENSKQPMKTQEKLVALTAADLALKGETLSEQKKNELLGLSDDLAEEIFAGRQKGQADSQPKVESKEEPKIDSALSSEDKALLDEIRSNQKEERSSLETKAKERFTGLSEETISSMSTKALKELVGSPKGQFSGASGSGHVWANKCDEPKEYSAPFVILQRDEPQKKEA